jgi:hypothetical protein
MELALRRRLEGVATVFISQREQTAAVVFAAGQHLFSPGEFRAAVGEADVEVISFEIEACGRVEEDGTTQWFVAGPNRFILVEGSSGLRTACIAAALQDGRKPPELDKIRPLPKPSAPGAH